MQMASIGIYAGTYLCKMLFIRIILLIILLIVILGLDRKVVSYEIAPKWFWNLKVILTVFSLCGGGGDAFLL
jgi:hypothetical protein